MMNAGSVLARRCWGVLGVSSDTYFGVGGSYILPGTPPTSPSSRCWVPGLSAGMVPSGFVTAGRNRSRMHRAGHPGG
jgi:hypothetical protein